MQRIEWLGERLELYGERGLFWPRRRTLLIADTHFAKDAAFRRAGIPIPLGTMAADLSRLGCLVDRTAAERVVVLGDFFHARPDPGEPFAERLAAWLEQRPGLALAAVPGNHDRHGGAAALAGAVEWLPEGILEPPFVFRHEPVADAAGYVLAGHLHPVVRLSTAARERLRVPVLWLTSAFGVLPSFGEFTGGARIRPGRGDRVWACGPGDVMEVPVGGEVSHA